MLRPAPVGAGGGRSAIGKAAIGIALVSGKGEILIPHRVGHHLVEAAQRAVAGDEGRAVHRIAQGDLGLHVVDKGVHARHGKGGWVDFLPVEVQRFVAGVAAVLLAEAQISLDEQAAGATGRIVDVIAGRGVNQMGHQHRHLARGIELARTLPLALGELAQEVLVCPPKNIRLHILQAEAVLRKALDERAQTVIVEDALAGGGFIEVFQVNHAAQFGVLARHGAHGAGQILAQVGHLAGDFRPAGFFGEIKAHQGVVLLYEPSLVAQLLQLVLEHIRQTLEEDERQDVILELGRIHRAADDTGGFPEPGFESAQVESHAQMFPPASKINTCPRAHVIFILG
ncbi:MAG: hypothetical protein BWY25_00675 [Chloroflexi bacterium ADurb.Bin222]|nr:MAG: hypothetical protein BWY25_00675 [Chloroflexi bacterium ADurb.Bin222]